MSYQQQPYSDNLHGGSYGHVDNDHSGGGNQYGDYHDDSDGYGNYGRPVGESYPMSSNNPYASAGYVAPKQKRNKWLWIGLPLLILVIIGAVLGGVLGTQLNKGGKSGGGGGNSEDANTGIPSGVTGVNTATSTGADGQRYLAVATDSYMLPVYATGTNTAGYSVPTTLASPAPNGKWPDDPSPPSTSAIRGHPRLIAPGYRWDALASGLIANDPYLSFWNTTIVGNASSTLGDDPVPYSIDGGLSGSGVLDVARQMKLKVKNWAYAYRITNNTAYADRVWKELQTAAGNNSAVPFGAGDGTRWNPAHFLDVGEFCNVFAIGYDWLYDYWTDDQRDMIMWSILNLGLQFGDQALSNDQAAKDGGYAWWAGVPNNGIVDGNWNCVINGGLTMAALAIVDRDPSGLAQKIIDATVPNAKANCFQAAHSDGTWTETANYWYFGTTGAAEMVSALTTAYGDDQGLSAENPGWAITSLYHIYVQGMTSLFNYGDHGPNKYATTANSLLLWSTIFKEPRYALYQRDHYDAPEPWSMFWYDPATTGTWWDGLALDNHFSDPKDDWATGRSTWADNSGIYWAMKSGALTGHQTHGDLDLGDFVLDAMGQRWFGELGSGQYLSDGYFSNETQESERWLYYRKRTEGQNTVLINYANQNVAAAPSSNFGSSNTQQGAAPSFNITSDDTAFYTTDLSSAYNNNTVKRGIRFLNGRRQVLLQDDIDAPSGTDVQWRAHTNASISLSDATATLTLGGSTLVASIVNGPSGAVFSTAAPTRASQDPPVPTGPNTAEDGDPENPGVTVLVIDNPNGGTYSLEVAFNPQWSGMDASSFVTPPNVGIDSWTLNSHKN